MGALTVHAGPSHPHHSLSLVARSCSKTAKLGLAKIYIFCTQETWQCAGIVHAGLPDLGERLPAKSNDSQSNPPRSPEQNGQRSLQAQLGRTEERGAWSMEHELHSPMPRHDESSIEMGDGVAPTMNISRQHLRHTRVEVVFCGFPLEPSVTTPR